MRKTIKSILALGSVLLMSSLMDPLTAQQSGSPAQQSCGRTAGSSAPLYPQIDKRPPSSRYARAAKCARQD